MNARTDPLDQIAARLDALEERVHMLEHPGQAEPSTPGVPGPASIAPATAWPEPSPEFTSIFPVIGRALLGIAGAYVLRAVSGANLLPRGVVAVMAALYAGGWLVAAGRAVGRRRMAGALYAAVSILILAPMLWEMSIRFGAMPADLAAAILALYVAAATVAGFRNGEATVFSVAYAGAAITAVALSIATHHMAEFTFILLAMVVVCEFGGTRIQAQGIRLLVALSADVGVWTLLLIYRLAPVNRTDYPAVSTAVVTGASVLLFAVAAAGVVRGALARGEPLPFFRSLQAVIAFGLAVCAVAWMMPGVAAAVLAVVCLMLSAACYAAAYGPMRRAGQRRNFRIFSLWAGCLFLGAAFMATTLSIASAILGLVAVGAIVLADRMHSLTIELQGVVFLAIAAAQSGLLAFTAHALAGSSLGRPGGVVLALAACSILAYAAGDEKAGEGWQKQALHLVPGALAAGAAAALLVTGMLELTRLMLMPDVFHVALIRTLALCGLATSLAYAGARLGRPQMIRMAYAAIFFTTAKLVFEDLRLGRLGFIAASIFAVALTLIAAPRLAKRKAVRQGGV